MRTLALMILTMGIVLTSGHARAQRYDPAYPVCLYVVSYGTTPYYRCSYTTMDQCRASANGQMCSLNPYYAGATAPVRRNNRRYYRQVESRSPAPAETGPATVYGVDWRKSDAFYFGFEPFDHPVWRCERGYGASRTPAARYCSSQLRTTGAADPLPGRTVQSLQ